MLFGLYPQHDAIANERPRETTSYTGWHCTKPSKPDDQEGPRVTENRKRRPGLFLAANIGQNCQREEFKEVPCLVKQPPTNSTPRALGIIVDEKMTAAHLSLFAMLICEVLVCA